MVTPDDLYDATMLEHASRLLVDARAALDVAADALADALEECVNRTEDLECATNLLAHIVTLRDRR